ncbi:response regulator [Deferrisoma camini]|uniref:response regulator n=1 Tax=Deferrisoma camini TaxID=1035120 RepID=UPI00046D3EAA|nr:response regulator [Deferrisoma camini]
MRRALIVDDAVTVRLYHRKILEEAGFQVEEAENGVEALEKALVTPYDLLLVDVNMPKMDGYTLLREVRSTPELEGVPAIMISTESEKHDREHAYRVGANLYLVKPVRPEAFRLLAALMARNGESR